MSGCIFKYKVGIEEQQTISVPKGAKLLTVQMQGDVPCIWAEVDITQPLVKRRIFICGTGCYLRAEAVHYIGTVQVGGFVWHFYSEEQS